MSALLGRDKGCGLRAYGLGHPYAVGKGAKAQVKGPWKGQGGAEAGEPGCEAEASFGAFASFTFWYGIDCVNLSGKNT